MHGLRSFSGPGELSPLISMDFAVLLPHQPGPRMAVQTGIRLALKIRELRCSELSYAPAHAHQAGRGFVIAVLESEASQIFPGMHVHAGHLRQDRADARLTVAPTRDRPHQRPRNEGAAIARQGVGAPQACRIVRLVAEAARQAQHPRSEEHTSELQSLMRISYAVFCLKKKK